MEEAETGKTEFETRLIALRKKKKRNFFLRLSAVILLFVLLGGYLLSPLSQVKGFSLRGNLNLSRSDILGICHLKNSTSLYAVDAKKCEELLNHHPLIRNGKVRSSIAGLSVSIEEIAPVIHREETCYLNDGSTMDPSWLESPLIGEFLETAIEKLPTDLSEAEALSEENVRLYGAVWFQVPKEEREKIAYASIESGTRFSYLFDFGSSFREVALNFPAEVDEADIAYALGEEAFARYEKEFFSPDSPNSVLGKDGYLKNFRFGEISFDYYSIEVTISYKFGTDKAVYAASVRSSTESEE